MRSAFFGHIAVVVASLSGIGAGAVSLVRSDASRSPTTAAAGGTPVSPTAAADPAARQDGARRSPGNHAFYFSRAQYGNRTGRRFGSWSVDYPKADRQFLVVLRRLTNLDAFEFEHPLRLDDPELRRFPFLYAVEVGYMALSEAEVIGLREYLLAGGFLMVDDFWGTYEWQNFESEMRRVLPEFPIVDLPLDHPIFSSFYDIREIIQVPNVGQGIAGGPTHERDGYVPTCRGIFDEHGRLMVVINWNTDLGDAWEWAEQARYPLKYSTFAYQMGVNFIVYAMSH